jgi:hypothetical protein
MSLRKFFGKRPVQLVLGGCCLISLEVASMHRAAIGGVRDGLVPVQSSLLESQPHDERTLVVPTLETPLPDHGSAVWCSSLAHAWRELRANVAPGPIEVVGAEALATALDKDAETAEGDVPECDVYAAAGFVKGGILGEIARELPRRFPHARPPEVSRDADVIAYAHLEVAVSFGDRYGENEWALRWKGSSGHTVWVRNFGLNSSGASHEPPAILCGELGYFTYGKVIALDLAPGSSPIEIVVARMATGSSLGATIRALDEKIAERKDREYLTPDTELMVPRVHLVVSREFPELAKRPIVGPQVPDHLMLTKAMQSVALTMDETGVHARTEADFRDPRGAPPRVIFDGPFLVMARKRGAARPFLVLWVDDASLLERG